MPETMLLIVSCLAFGGFVGFMVGLHFRRPIELHRHIRYDHMPVWDWKVEYDYSGDYGAMDSMPMNVYYDSEVIIKATTEDEVIKIARTNKRHWPVKSVTRLEEVEWVKGGSDA